MYNIPNIISLARIAIVPLIVIVMSLIEPTVASPAATVWNQWASFGAALLFGIAAISDIVDGFLARRSDSITIFGKLFDPLADKLLTFGALVMLIPLGRMSAWLTVVVLAREVGVTTLRGIASSEGIVIAAGKWGKMKNAFSNAGLSLLILYYPFVGIDWYYIGWVLFLISVILGIASGLQYLIHFLHTMHQLPGQR